MILVNTILHTPEVENAAIASQPSPDKFIQMGRDSAVAHLPIHNGAQTHWRLSVKPILRAMASHKKPMKFRHPGGVFQSLKGLKQNLAIKIWYADDCDVFLAFEHGYPVNKNMVPYWTLQNPRKTNDHTWSNHDKPCCFHGVATHPHHREGSRAWLSTSPWDFGEFQRPWWMQSSLKDLPWDEYMAIFCHHEEGL